jgi:hypothetical protein
MGRTLSCNGETAALIYAEIIGGVIPYKGIVQHSPNDIAFVIINLFFSQIDDDGQFKNTISLLGTRQYKIDSLFVCIFRNENVIAHDTVLKTQRQPSFVFSRVSQAIH